MKIIGKKAEIGMKLLIFFSLITAFGFFVFNTSFSSAVGDTTYTGTDSTLHNIPVYNHTLTFTSNETWYAFNNSGVTNVTMIANYTNRLSNVSSGTASNFTFNTTHIKMTWRYNDSGYYIANKVNVSYIYDNASQVIQFTLVIPENDTILYYKISDSDVSPWLNITLNATFEHCRFQWRANGTWTNMTNGSLTNKTWVNATAEYPFIDNVTDNSWHNMTFHCFNKTKAEAANGTMGLPIGGQRIMQVYANMSDGPGYRFKVFSPSYFPDVTIRSANYSSNDSFWKKQSIVNITTNGSVTNCTLLINDTAIILLTNSTPRNLTEAGVNNTVWWTNNSNMDTYFEADTPWNGTKYNFTYYCSDAFGNRSWYNTTNETNNAERIFITLDTTAPTLGTHLYTVANKTSGGHYLNISFNVTDETDPSCWVAAYHESGTRYNFSTERVLNFSRVYNWGHNPFVYINITPDDVEQDGLYIIEPRCTDKAGNQGKATTNKSMVFYRLETGWNLLAIPYNMTLIQLGSLTTNITYVSVFNNYYANKTYITWTAGSATDATYMHNATNSTYFYVADDVVFMTNLTSTVAKLENVTLWTNKTSYSGWNQMGVGRQNRTLNQTLWGECLNYTIGERTEEINVGANATWNKTNQTIIDIINISNTTSTFSLVHQRGVNGTGNYSTMSNYTGSFVLLYDWNNSIDCTRNYNISYYWTTHYADSGCRNISYVSFYDIHIGRYCTAYRDKSITTCYPNYTSTNLTIPYGSGLWVYPTINLTYNRSRVKDFKI